MREAAPLRVSASLLNGLPTAILPSRPYTRAIRAIAFSNSVEGGVTIYKGTTTAKVFVDSSPVGDSQGYTVPFKLPGGQNCLVQWDNTPPSLADAFAVFTWMEE